MVVLLEQTRALFLTEKGVEKEDIRRVIDKELLKGKRVVWLGDQRVLYGKSKDVESFLQSERVYTEPAYYEEFLGFDEEEKLREFNLYVVNGKEIGAYLYQKPTCLVPVLFILKKEGEKRFGKEKFLFGYYSPVTSEALIVSCENGRVRKSRTEKAPRKVIQEELERSGIRNLFVAGITIPEEEFYRILLETPYLRKEYTPLNEVLREIFLEEEDTVKLIRTLKVGGALLFASALFYVGTSVYSFNLEKKVSSLSRQVGTLKHRLEREKRKRLISYVWEKSLHPEKVKLVLPEAFLDRLTEKEITYTVPRNILSAKDEVSLVEKLKKAKCSLALRSRKTLRFSCRGEK